MLITDPFKNQVRQLARYLEISINIFKKTPTAVLWPKQSDEEEFGISYDLLDLILYGDESGVSEKEITSNLKIASLLVYKILECVRSNEHKRWLPLILRLSSIIG